MKIQNITVIHGPNLNLLGQREPDHYGTHTLGDINDALTDEATILNLNIEAFQSNSEAEIVDKTKRLKTNKS